MVAARTTHLLHGGDPAPGDPVAVRHVIGQLRSAVDSVADAANLIRGVGTDRAMWTGSAADSFAHKLNELLRRLSTAQAAYESAADALTRWVARLEQAQHEAASIVARARAAAHAAAAQSGGHLAGRPPTLVPLQHARDALERRARADAQTCAHALEAASQQVGHFQHSVGEQIGRAWHAISAELVDVRGVLQEITGVLGVLTFVTALIPGVGEAVAVVELISLAATVALTAADVTLAASGRQSWWVVAGDGLTIGVGGAGKVAGRVFTEAKNAEQLGASAKAARGISTTLGRGLRQAETRLVAGQGSLDEVKMLAQARGVARADAAELGKLARAAERESGLGAALRAVAQDPADFAGAAEAKTVANAAGYTHLPRFSHWLPSDARQAVAVGAHVGLSANDGREAITQIEEWLHQALTGQPGPTGGGGTRR